MDDDVRFCGATGGFCSDSEIRCTSLLGYRKREAWPVGRALIDGKDVGSEVVFISRDCVCFEGAAAGVSILPLLFCLFLMERRRLLDASAVRSASCWRLI